MIRIILTFWIIKCAFFLNAQQTISIDVTKVKTDLTKKKSGLCNSFILDDIAMKDRLRELKPKTLRYPMGTIAENYLFHDPQKYNQIEEGLIPTAFTDDELKPWNRDINADLAWADYVMDFDEFMELCDYVGAEPVIMLSSHGHLLDGATRNFQDVVRNAEEWVRYANVTKGYGIKYWEIGNENELAAKFSASEYADAFDQIATAIKEVDPSVHAGVGVLSSADWYREVLESYSSQVDFLVCHVYVFSNSLPNYNAYKTNSRDGWGWIRILETTINSIDEYAAPEDRNRIKVMATEHGIGYVNNELWEAIGSFDQLAAMLSYDDRVLYTHSFVTSDAWGSRTGTESANSLDHNNNWKILNRGRFLQVFNQFARDKMLEVSRFHGHVRSYASYTSSNKELTVYLVNNNDESESISVDLINYSGNLANEKWVFTGAAPTALSHTWAPDGSVSASPSGFSIDLDPASITVVVFKPSSCFSPPVVEVSYTNETSQDANDGSITFSFSDMSGRTNIEFSLDGGISYPYNVRDDIGSTTVSHLPPDAYDLWARWGNDECPTDLGSVEILSSSILSESMAYGSVIVRQTANQWYNMSYGKNLTNPVVVMGPISHTGGHPCVMRIRNVTSTGFQYQLSEWDYLDGNHAQETVYWLALEAGIHEHDGLKWEAGFVDDVTHDWKNKEFHMNYFDAAPTLLAQIMTLNGDAPVTTRLNLLSKDGFKVRVQKEEAADHSHPAEQIAYIAISRGQGSLPNGQKVVSALASDINHIWTNVDFQQNISSPMLLGNICTYNGSQTVGLRYRSLSNSGVQFEVEEEKSLDEEINHNPENICYLLLEGGGVTSRDSYLVSEVPLNPESDSNHLLYPNPSSENVWIRIEANQDVEIVFHILDLKGSALKTFKQQIHSGENYCEFDVGDLEAGVYVLVWNERSLPLIIK